MKTENPAWTRDYEAGQAAGAMDAADGHAPRCDVSDPGPWDHGYLSAYCDASGLDSATVLDLASAGGLQSAALATLRNAQGSWAGGNTFVSCNIGVPSATGDSLKAWSKNGKWTGLNAHYSLTVPSEWSTRVGSVLGLATAGGLLTLDATPREPINGYPAWDAVWCRNGRGFDVVVERGVICFQTVTDRWLHGKTETAIRRLLAPRQARKPADPAKAQAARWSRWERQHGSVVVTVDQHERAGNCYSGTVQWSARHFEGRTSATVAELVAWLRAGGSDQPERVESAIKAAIASK